MGEIQDAAMRLNERKEAVGAEGGVVLVDTASPVFSGLDFDPIELERAARMAEVVAGTLLDNGQSAPETASALWLDGIAMGMLVAEARGRG